MGEETPPTLAEFVGYLPQIQALDLSGAELRAIRVHPEPASDDEFISLGELPPGAPPVGPMRFPPVGTRQLYVYHSEAPESLWQRFVVGLTPHRPSGTGGTGMFGTPEERVVDEENPRQGWRRLDAGRRPFDL